MPHFDYARLLRCLQADLLGPIRVFVRLGIGLYVLPIAHIHQTRPCKLKNGVWWGRDYAGNGVIDPYSDHRPKNHAIRHGGVVVPRTNQTAKFARFIEDRATTHATDEVRLDLITSRS